MCNLALAALTLASLLGLGSSVAHAGAQGYRGDGTGRVALQRSAHLWDGRTAPRWSTPTPAWSNAGVTLAGSLACTTAEPTTLVCLHRSTGRPAWSATNDYADTLQPDARAAHLARVDGVPALQTAHRDALSRFSAVRRQVRADPTALDALLAAQQDVSRLRAQLDALAPMLTPPDREIIGYASATPVFDGTHLYAQFAQGVVSSFALDGTRRWSVWLGPPPGAMRGYHMGASASPVLIDGVLVVGQGHLTGLDPATGAVLWTADPYADYGTPAPLTVDGVGYVALPDGHVVRARDGAVVLDGLGDVLFTGPVVAGDTVFYVGGPSAEFLRPQGFMAAKAWRLSAEAGRLAATPVWDVKMPVFEALYSGAVVHDSGVYFMDRLGVLRRLDRATGALTEVIALTQVSEVGQVYAPLTLAGTTLLAVGEQGGLVALPVGQEDPAITHAQVGPGRAGITVDVDGTAYVRTLDQVLAVGGPP